MRKLLITRQSNQHWMAVIENDQPVEFIVCHANGHNVGGIYKGIVKKWLPEINAYFIDIGQKKDGFLPAENMILSELGVGDEIIVQVEKESSRFKGAKLTMYVSIPGEVLVYLPYSDYIAVSKKLNEADRAYWRTIGESLVQKNEGLIFRTAVNHSTQSQVTTELLSLRKAFEQLSKKSTESQATACLYQGQDEVDQCLDAFPLTGVSEIVTDDKEILMYSKDKLNKDESQHPSVQLFAGEHSLFHEYGIEGEWSKALKKVVWLQSGGYLLFEEMETLTVIDVNTGKSRGNRSKEEHAVHVNIEAAREAVTQLRLRNLGGMIVIDFLRMTCEKDRMMVAGELERGVKADRRTTKLFGFTSMGLFELTRKKIGPSLKESLEQISNAEL